MEDKAKGLENKYIVQRVDGKPFGKGIFLEFSDPNAWTALEQWANTVESAGYCQLAHDVRREISLYKAVERVFGPERT